MRGARKKERGEESEKKERRREEKKKRGERWRGMKGCEGEGWESGNKSCGEGEQTRKLIFTLYLTDAVSISYQHPQLGKGTQSREITAVWGETGGKARLRSCLRENVELTIWHCQWDPVLCILFQIVWSLLEESPWGLGRRETGSFWNPGRRKTNPLSMWMYTLHIFEKKQLWSRLVT